MGGLYIHIPFCSQACRYCDFFFTVSLNKMDEYVECLVRELKMLGDFHRENILDTVYLGGGTPSLLSGRNLEMIFGAVHASFTIQKNAEITMECNPDDLKPAFFQKLKQFEINRLSIGVQSFHEKDLELLRRSHDDLQAERSVKDAADAGFSNITIDLIYGIPGQTIQDWEANLIKAVSLPITHLSAYHLTFEPGTVFDHWRKKGRLVPVHEEESIALYRMLRERMAAENFDHYEISNFALNGKMSRHNLLYWSGLPYLGAGPSAHSFDGERRSWNVSSLKGYIERLKKNLQISEQEELSLHERYHDYLITSLRTKWGADGQHIKQVFGSGISSHFNTSAGRFLENGSMWQVNGKIAVHPDHWLITDHILRELFLD